MKIGFMYVEVFLGNDDDRVDRCGEQLFAKLVRLSGRKRVGRGLVIDSDAAKIETFTIQDLANSKKLVIRMEPKSASYIDRYTEALGILLDTLSECIDDNDIAEDYPEQDSYEP